MMKDYYTIIGVSRYATVADIKRSFRKKAIRLHPDKNSAPNAKELFIELYEAYEILTDTTRRERYNNLYDVFIKKNKAKKEIQSETEELKQWIALADKNGEAYAKDFAFFSREVLKKTAIVLAVELIFTVLGLHRGVLSLGFLTAIFGFFTFFKFFEDYDGGYIVVSLMLIIFGAFLFKLGVKKIHE